MALAPAVTFAVSAGIATFFAPCAFPLLPGYVGYFVGRHENDVSGVLAAGMVAGGALVSFGVVSVLAFTLGRTVTGYLPLFEPVVGVGLIVFGGLTLLGRVPTVSVVLPERPDSLIGFGAFGAVYSLAAAGCVVPLFLGVLGQALTLSAVESAVVLGAYAFAVAAPLVGVTLLASVGIDEWKQFGKYSGNVERIAAVLMILAGVGQLYLSMVVLDVFS